MVADALVENVDLDLFTMVVVPGGSVGVENLGKCDKLAESLRDRMKANKLVGSICAGPTILQTLIYYKVIKRFATQDAKLTFLLGSISKRRCMHRQEPYHRNGACYCFAVWARTARSTQERKGCQRSCLWHVVLGPDSPF